LTPPPAIAPMIALPMGSDWIGLSCAAISAWWYATDSATVVVSGP
jgi:hypothetical protein